MVQVAALSQTFAAHVAAQAAQIEELYACSGPAVCVFRISSALLTLSVCPSRYTVACESSRNLQRGNAELETTIRRSGGARRTVAILLLAASLFLLLLDWASG